MADDVKCPICSGNTILRTAKKGPDTGKQFYVCRRYPECKGKAPIVLAESASPSLSDSDKFDCMYDAFRNQCNAMFTNYEENMHLKSFFMGGNVTALLVVTHCTDLRKLWGAGSIEMAKSLSEVFALEMISIWSRQNAENDRDSKALTQDAIDKLTKSLATGILNICEDYSEETLVYFINMDKQLNHDRDIGNHGFLRDALLLARACEVCGQGCIYWNKVTFPVKSQRQLAESNAIKRLPPPPDSLQMKRCVVNGVQAMYEIQQVEL